MTISVVWCGVCVMYLSMMFLNFDELSCLSFSVWLVSLVCWACVALFRSPPPPIRSLILQLVLVLHETLSSQRGTKDCISIKNFEEFFAAGWLVRCTTFVLKIYLIHFACTAIFHQPPHVTIIEKKKLNEKEKGTRKEKKLFLCCSPSN